MKIKINKKAVILILVLLFIFVMIFISVKNSSMAYGAPIVEEPGNNPGTEEETVPPVNEPDNSGTATNNNTNNSSGTNISNRAIDTRLRELSIECGELIPTFSPEQYSYTVYVNGDNENKSCRTSATAMDTGGTTITAEGPSEFSDEDIQKIIKVTGNDGSSSEYVINVHIIKDTELLIGADLYSISESLDIGMLPGDFEKVEIEFKGKKIKAAKNQENNLCLVCFTNGSDEALWYMLSSDKENLYPVKLVDYNGKKYIDISNIGTIVYGDNGGNKGYYLLDKDTGEVILDIINSSAPVERNGLLKDKNIVMMIVISIAALICFICCICLFRQNRKIKTENCNKNKYFRPYIHLEDEQAEIIGGPEKATSIDEKEQNVELS